MQAGLTHFCSFYPIIQSVVWYGLLKISYSNASKQWYFDLPERSLALK